MGKELRPLSNSRHHSFSPRVQEVRAGSFSRKSRALRTLSVCATCSLITFPQAVCPKRETFLTQERLPRRGTRILESHSDSPEERPRGWRGGPCCWSEHTLSFGWVCSWTGVPAMSLKSRDNKGNRAVCSLGGECTFKSVAATYSGERNLLHAKNTFCCASQQTIPHHTTPHP